jgi:hypothetical protein
MWPWRRPAARRDAVGCFETSEKHDVMQVSVGRKEIEKKSKKNSRKN